MKPVCPMIGKIATCEVQGYGSEGKTLAKCVLQSGDDRIPFTAFGRLVQTASEYQGRRVIVEAELGGREYQGRIYLECVARNIYLTAQEQERQATQPEPPKPQPQPQPKPATQPSLQRYTQAPEPAEDDIPF